ncbi:hypothetical protein [Paremcibacter congregatus]|jgi:hypothetical protein|uniref:Uncharacterized protein n=1 Tax=Paremcibacter congregatus TaxID=2043170 RepID=A0A2G4YRT7_9PROT|nr:hypothetical protein [Paremcibacter congregatus]PHZ85028.1 hypothetical protein CRD36_09935 [Paremcibacter congregatus]QDE25997.1 hypothetical protein FIV45_01215 [Paremcibacter congregatus]|tara:strand:+ start:1089 stop:1274 length:186 start_codon:yes stop_codon:yes gene_type:complete
MRAYRGAKIDEIYRTAEGRQSIRLAQPTGRARKFAGKRLKITGEDIDLNAIVQNIIARKAG